MQHKRVVLVHPPLPLSDVRLERLAHLVCIAQVAPEHVQLVAHLVDQHRRQARHQAQVRVESDRRRDYGGVRFHVRHDVSESRRVALRARAWVGRMVTGGGSLGVLKSVCGEKAR